MSTYDPLGLLNTNWNPVELGRNSTDYTYEDYIHLIRQNALDAVKNYKGTSTNMEDIFREAAGNDYAGFTPDMYNQWQKLEHARIDPQRAKAEADYNSGSGSLGTLGAIGFGTIGTLVGGPVLGGAMAGAVKGLSSSPSAGFGEAITGAAKGAGMGWAGGQIAGGMFTGGGSAATAGAGEAAGMGAVDYGLTAGGVPSLSTYGAGGLAGTGAGSLSTYGMGGLTGALSGTGGTALGALAGAGGMTGSAMAGSPNLISMAKDTYNTASNVNKIYNTGKTIFGSTPQGSTPQTAGGGMAGLNVQDLYNMINPIVGAGASYLQGDQSNQGYERGINTMLTPSADQQQYRTQLSGLMTDPTSFFQSPVYQAAFGQGQQATERAINARGLSGSGRELAELQKYGQTFGFEQLMKQAGLLGDLSGITTDPQSRARAGEAMIGQGKVQSGTTAAIQGDLSMGAAQLLGTGQGGSGWGNIPLSSIFSSSNQWFPDSTQYTDLISQQEGFNWSGIGGVIGGSEQDMMLNDQWDWSW